MRRWHLGLNGLGLLLGLAVVGLSLRMPIFDPSGPGGGFLPMILGAMLALSSLALLMQPFAELVSEDSRWPDRDGFRRVAAVVLSLAAFAILMPLLGFLATAILVMLCLLPIIARRGWVFTLFVALACSGGVYFVFVRLLGLNLPRGPWGF